MYQLLHQTALFSGIDKEEVKKIAKFSELVTHQAGEEPVVNTGEMRHPDLLLLLVGEVSVGTKLSPLPAAVEVDLHPIDNELFGEVAWIQGSKRSANVTCKTECKFIRIHGNKLYDFCHAHPAVGIVLIDRVASVLAQRVIRLTELVRDKSLY